MTMSHVLIVDDDPALLQALPEALRLRLGEGVAVVTCDSALAALDLLATTDYDAIITDIKMPGMDGLALLAKIRALRPDTPTLLITGHGEHDLAVQALRGGAYDFIQKPIDRDHLVASLRRALQLRQLSRQVAQQRQALERHAAELEQLVAERTCELRAANQAKDELLHREQAARAEAEAAQRRLAFLAEASHLLAASLDYRSTLASVARLAVPSLADCCIIDTLEDDGTTREVTIAHDDPAKEGLVRAWWRHSLTQSTGDKPRQAAWRPGQSVGDGQHAGPAPSMAANGDAQCFQALGITDRMIVPLLARGRTLGMIAFLAAGRRYSPAELTLAEDLASRAALALDNARLHAATVASEERFRTSVENLLDGLGIYSAMRDEAGQIIDFRIDYINAAGAASIGVPAVELFGRTLCDILPSHRDNGLLSAYRCVVETGEPFAEDGVAFEDVYAGELRRQMLDLRASRLGDGFVVAWRDVTARARAEQAVRESEARFRTIFASNMVAIGLWTGDGTIDQANDALLDLLGFTRQELEAGAVRWANLTPPEYRHLEERAIAESREHGHCTPYEKEYVRKDGRRVPVLVGGAYFRRAADGYDPTTGVFFALDLSTRKRAEAALAESEARLRSIIAAAVDGIIAIDEFGMIESVNPAAERLFGYAAAELIGRNVSVLMASPYHEEHDGYLAHYRTTGERRIIGIGREVVGRRKDGGTFPMDLAVSEVALEGRRLFIGLVRDITERKEVERLQQEFLSLVTHELKNPLTGLSSYAQLMQRHQVYQPSAVAAILRESKRLERLIDDLLDVTRAEAGQLSLYLASVDLMSVARVIVDSAQAQTTDHRIDLVAPAESVIGWWDQDRLEQVLQNLLFNAIKYSPDGGLITVAVEPRDEEVVVKVADQGLGLAPEVLSRLFERFYRTDDATRRRLPGLGLGLYISRRLVEAHRGRIWAESSGPGRGSCFGFTLPIRPSPSSPRARPGAFRRPARN